uniref:gap junction gamma-1 protein-like n=1 Tax=Oncorhynchus gorbuscha TaxID=8017 RepID=UPI001EAF650E|nr:gap junction gamma-1 protein-like [Oncorhynchus gorbuscha]
MTEWTLLKRLLDAVHQHSTMIGRLWLTVMVIFRLLIIAVATEDVYADEQEMFVCNTLQPGCATVCYDVFAPISQPRFWVFHIISVSTPSLCFIIYTWHNLSKLPQGHSGQGQGVNPRDLPRDGGKDGGREAFNWSCDSDSCSIRSHRHLGHSLANVLEGITAQSQSLPKELPPLEATTATSLTQARLACHRNSHYNAPGVLEVEEEPEASSPSTTCSMCAPGAAGVPFHFCKAPPCTQPVDCYVSRPTEKTIFLLFMFWRVSSASSSTFWSLII